MAQRQHLQKIIEKGSYSKAAAVPRNQEHKWQQGKGTKKVRKDLMYASEDIILLPPALSTLPAPTTTFPVTSITPGTGHQTK